MNKLTAHPRLYINNDCIERLRAKPSHPFIAGAHEAIERDADEYAKNPPLKYARNVHNEHLVRARETQGRVVTLIARWIQTGDERFRCAVIKHVEMMGEWEYWSWITWRQNNPAPDAIFDLSYGENSTTLAIAYDLLHDTLSQDEKRLLVETAKSRPILSALKHMKPGGAGWFGRPDSNWNTVCAGGAGMLAMAMFDEIPEAAQLIARADESFEPYMLELDKSDGGWPEGIGYWNYGMRYAFMYLMSRENAEGKQHPLLRRAATRKTLSFPLDFCPDGNPCSFGDVNSWSPLPFHYAAARLLKCDDVTGMLDAIIYDRSASSNPSFKRMGGWPNAVEWAAFHPGTSTTKKKSASEFSDVKLYRGLDWGVIADRMPNPHIYASVRGGTTKVPHGHRDLLSFHCVVDGVAMLTNLTPAGYLDTTFSPRRQELYEIGPASKNTLLINGVGIIDGSSLERTQIIKRQVGEGIRMAAGEAFGVMRDGSAVEFCARLILLLKKEALLVIDRIILPHVGLAEARFHSFADARLMKTGAALKRGKASMRMSFGSNVPFTVAGALSAPTNPTSQSANIIRLCSTNQHKDMVFATLLSHGTGKARVKIGREEKRFALETEWPGGAAAVKLTDRLIVEK